MKIVDPSRLGWLLFAFLALGSVAAAVGAQEESPAATRQYAAAARLQNLKSYDLAAEAWLKFVSGFGTDPRIDQAYYNLGICYYLDNNFDQAQATFQKLIKRPPKLEKLDAAYLYLGVTQYSIAKSGKVEAAAAAVRTFDTLIAKFPQGEFVPDALYYRGECLYMAGKKQEAVAAYQQLVAKYPKHAFVAEALYATGVCQQESEQPDEAVKTYDLFLKTFPKHAFAPEVNLRRGETLFGAGQFDAAARSFAAAAATPDYDLADYALVRQADCRVQMKQHVEAAAVYESLPAKFPKSEHRGRATVAAGKCYYLAGNYPQARKLLSEPLAADDPAAYEAAHWIARSWLQEKFPAKAVAELKKVLPKAQAAKSAMAPQLLMDEADAAYETPARRKESVALYAALAAKYKADAVAPQALYMAGFTALELGENAAALKHANAFLAAYPKHDLVADVTHIKAESHLLLRQFAEAESQYQQLLKRYPDHSDAELWKVRRGLLFHLQKKYRETIDALAPALAEVRRPELVAEARYLIGASQTELGEHAQAVASLEGSLTAQAKWRQADETLLTLARAYGQLKDHAKAKAAVDKLIAEFPQSKVLDKAHYRLGEYAYLAGDFAAAAAAYRKVTTDWPQSPLAPYALHELGCAQMDADDNAGSERSLTTFLEAHPNHELASTARFSRGMARHRLGKSGPAIEDLQAFLATNPPATEKSNARYLLGLCQMALDQHAPATATFQALLKDEPDYESADNAFYQLAWALKLSDNEAEAAKSFEQLASKHPESKRAAEAHYHVGEFMYQKQDYQQSAVAYYRAMKTAGKSELDEKAAHKLAWSYYHRNEFQKAHQTFGYQRITYPQGTLAADAAFMEAECLFKQEKYQEALAAFEPVGKLSNPDFQILRLLHAGQAATQLKQWEKSLQFLQQGTDQFPDSPYAPQAFYEQGWAQQSLANFDQAVKLYQRVIGITDGEVAARAQFMIGEVQFAQKDYKEAIRSYFKVMYGYSFPTWQAEATFEAARCFEVLEKVDQAVDLYRELLEKFPQSDRVVLAKERIEKLAP
ncbi:MAG: tetratricopeptide repeat protein [Planctomycetes bacterium]|nr:tetratricopeptide repeat protein [Planctomycetota bacterium]